LQEATLI